MDNNTVLHPIKRDIRRYYRNDILDSIMPNQNIVSQHTEEVHMVEGAVLNVDISLALFWSVLTVVVCFKLFKMPMNIHV